MNSIARSLILVIILFLIFPTLGCNKSDSGSDPNIVSISDLLPRENEISGWARNSGSDGSWKATNASELQDQINGGSEIFTNHGFIEAAMQNLTGTVNTQSGVICEIQVYDQGSDSDAIAVFDDPNNVYASPLTPSNPPSAKAQIRKDLFSWTMKFVKGHYYVLINILTSEDKGQEVLEVFANNVAGKIQ
jgi:Family of unknown function (DUF6599)